jgi:predicted deacylase
MATTDFSWIPVTTLASGGELRLPLHTVRGAKPGPTLGLSALVHGNEPVPSVGIIRAVLERLDPAELRGTVLAVPVLNPLGYAGMSRHTPEDGLNLNGAFVRSDAGGHPEPVKTVSVELAATIGEGFLSKLNYQIDFHTGGNATVHMIEFTEDEESTAMARAFNMPILLKDVWMPGQMWTRAEQLGVKAIVAELGGAGQLYHEWVERGVAGTLNVMRRLGMLPGEVAPPPRQYVVNNTAGHEENLNILRPREAGLIVPEPAVTPRAAFDGQPLVGAQVLGRLISPYDLTERQVFETPFERTLMLATRVAPTWCTPGEFGYIIVDADKAEVLDG